MGRNAAAQIRWKSSLHCRCIDKTQETRCKEYSTTKDYDNLLSKPLYTGIKKNSLEINEKIT